MLGDAWIWHGPLWEQLIRWPLTILVLGVIAYAYYRYYKTL